MGIKKILKGLCPTETNEELVGAIDLNDVLINIGYWGRFHYIQTLLLLLICLPTGITYTHFVFTGFLPDHRCVIPQCESHQNATFYGQESNEYTSLATEGRCKRITFSDDGDSSCDKFISKLKSNDSESFSQRKIVSCQDDVVFDKNFVESSFSIHYGFYCSNFYLKGIFSALVLLGMVVGSFVSGIASDKMGRKTIMVILTLFLPVFGVICAFKPPIVIFVICQIIMGMTAIGIFICASVIIAESTLNRMRLTSTRILSLAFVFGGLYNVTLAYGLRNEFHLQLAIYCPMFLLMIPCYFVLESTRWLISKGRIEEAKKQIEYIAMVNKSAVPESYNPLIRSNEYQKKDSVRELFKPRLMLSRTLLLFFQWFSVQALTAKLIFGFTALSGNPYGNFAIGTVIQLPSVLISMYLIDRLGRRLSGAIFMILGGILTVTTGFIFGREDLATLQIILAGTGRACTKIVWGTVYLYAMEMYPTSSRATALGTCSTIGRLGGIFALSIGGLRQVWPGSTFVIIGVLAICSGLAGLLLPETTGEKLPETKEKALKIGQNYKLVPWCKCSDNSIQSPK